MPQGPDKLQWYVFFDCICLCYATFLRVFFSLPHMNGMSSKSLGCFFCWLAVSLWQENSERALLEKFKKDWQEASRIMEWFLWHELNRSVPVKPVDDRLKVLCPRIKHHCFQFTKVLESNLAFICICLFIYRQVLFQLLTDSLLYCNFVPRRWQYVLANGWVVMGYIFLKERDTDRCSPCNVRLLQMISKPNLGIIWPSDRREKLDELTDIFGCVCKGSQGQPCFLERWWSMTLKGAGRRYQYLIVPNSGRVIITCFFFGRAVCPFNVSFLVDGIGKTSNMLTRSQVQVEQPK